VRWFGNTDAYSDSNGNRYGYSNGDSHGYSDSDRDGYSNRDSHGYSDSDRDGYSNRDSHTHRCTDANSYSFTCAELLALDQSSVGESSAHGRNRHLYRDDYADKWLQFAS
jgi:hypothetical protein